MYVTALLDVHRKYSTLVQESFSSDQGFTMALDKVRAVYGKGVVGCAIIFRILSLPRLVEEWSTATLSPRPLTVPLSHPSCLPGIVMPC